VGEKIYDNASIQLSGFVKSDGYSWLNCRQGVGSSIVGAYEKGVGDKCVSCIVICHQPLCPTKVWTNTCVAFNIEHGKRYFYTSLLVQDPDMPSFVRP
jgi:hypothetical protein